MKRIIQAITQTIKGLTPESPTGSAAGAPKKESVTWFSKKISKIKEITKGTINPTSPSLKKDILNDSMASKTFKFKKPGYIYFFQYSPPNKKQLPFYDEFPIILTLGFVKNTMIGINLHYLPIKIRLMFVLYMVKSMVVANNDISKIRIGGLLANKTIRKYIYVLSEEYYLGGIRSKVKLIGPKEFLVMAFLPVHKFRKKQEPQIHKIVRGMIKNIK